MPESWSSCGVLKTPAERMTSFLAYAVLDGGGGDVWEERGSAR